MDQQQLSCCPHATSNSSSIDGSALQRKITQGKAEALRNISLKSDLPVQHNRKIS